MSFAQPLLTGAWAPVADSQVGVWQQTRPSSVQVESLDTPGGAALGSLPLGGDLAFTYIPNPPVWYDVQDANSPGWAPVTV